MNRFFVHGLIATVAALAFMPRDARALAIPITACTVISQPGAYAVAKAINAATGDCIVVKAKNVLLSLNGQTLTGTAQSGAAIHVMPKAANVTIEGGSAIITGFTNGIEIESNGAVVDDFNTTHNSANGVWLHHASNARVFSFETTTNGVAGVLLEQRNGNVIGEFDAMTNTFYGVWLERSSSNWIIGFGSNDSGTEIYLGCSMGGPSGKKCKPGPQSSNNQIVGGSVGIGLIWTPNYGVVIDSGSVGNRVIGINARNSTIDDLFDENPNCATNLWFDNQFRAAMPACVD